MFTTTQTSTASARLGYAIIWVANSDSAGRFYEKVFGFARIRDMQTPVTHWVELDVGGPSLAFAEFGEADILFPAGYRAHAAGEAPVASAISFLTDDVAGAHSRALAEGAVSLQAPQDEVWGQTVARFRDPNGVVVSLATPMQN
jgi:lactoylglutathione lyase